MLRIRNASYTDHGLYQCILSNQIVSSTRNFTLKIQNTKPQCIEDAEISCSGESSFKLKFKPGYDGGHKQEFRLFYRHVPDQSDYSTSFDAWESTDTFEESFVELNDLEKFAKYQFFIEAKNLLGATNCTLKDQYSKYYNL